MYVWGRYRPVNKNCEGEEWCAVVSGGVKGAARIATAWHKDEKEVVGKRAGKRAGKRDEEEPSALQERITEETGQGAPRGRKRRKIQND